MLIVEKKMKIDGNYIVRDDLIHQGMKTGYARLSWHGHGKAHVGNYWLQPEIGISEVL